MLTNGLTDGSERWLGLTNPDRIKCKSASKCNGERLWMDGTLFQQDTW